MHTCWMFDLMPIRQQQLWYRLAFDTCMNDQVTWLPVVSYKIYGPTTNSVIQGSYRPSSEAAFHRSVRVPHDTHFDPEMFSDGSQMTVSPSVALLQMTARHDDSPISQQVAKDVS